MIDNHAYKCYSLTALIIVITTVTRMQQIHNTKNPEWDVISYQFTIILLVAIIRTRYIIQGDFQLLRMHTEVTITVHCL